MTQCKSYTYEVAEKSPLYPLVLAMKAGGMTDAGRDRGYAQIDYSAPWKPAKTVGAGDCFVDAREDEERGLENWRKYRKELAQYYGAERLMWEFAEPPPNPEKKGSKDEALFTQVQRAIGKIRGEMEKQKLDSASDEYKQKMAEALFYFYEFPSKTKWASYDSFQKKEVFARMDRLSEISLPRFRDYLVKNGGCDHFYPYMASASSNYNPFGFGFGGISAQSASLLFAIYEEAGLDPTFMEITDDEDDNYTCGMPRAVMYGVGIPLSSGLRVFNVYNHDTDVKGGFVYPLNLRQALGSGQAMTQAMDTIISRTPSDTDFEKAFSADGFSSAYLGLSNLLLELSKKNNPEIVKMFEKYVERHRPEFHPLLLSYLDLILRTQSAQRGEPDSAVPQGPSEIFAWLSNHYKTIKKDAAQGLDLARQILSRDPKCVMGHLTIARIGAAGLSPIEDDEIEGHYIRALAGIPPGNNSEHSVNVAWGAFYLKRGRIDEARKKFEAALNSSTARTDTRAKAAYYLALSDANSAATWLEKAAQLIKIDLGMPDDPTNAKDWFDFLKEAGEENPEMHAALKTDQYASASLARIWLIVGQALIMTEKFTEAIEALVLAKSMCQPSDIMIMDFALHEAYMRSGDMAAADKILEDAFR